MPLLALFDLVIGSSGEVIGALVFGIIWLLAGHVYPKLAGNEEPEPHGGERKPAAEHSIAAHDKPKLVAERSIAAQAEIDELAAAFGPTAADPPTVVAGDARVLAREQTRRRVADLVQQHGDDANTWVGELAHRNIGGVSTSDHVRFVADLIERYAVNRPWLVTERTARQMRSFRDAHPPRESAEDGRWLIETFRDDVWNSALLRRRLECRDADSTSGTGRVVWNTDATVFMPDGTPEGLDVLLGIAGYFPYGERMRPDGGGLHLEWRNHVTVSEGLRMGSLLKVSYDVLSRGDGSVTLAQSDWLSHVLDNTWYALRSLVAAVQMMEQRTRLGGGLTYLHSWPPNKDGNMCVECSHVSNHTIRDMIAQLQRLADLRDKLRLEKSRGQAATIFSILNGVAPFVDLVLRPLEISPPSATNQAGRLHHLTLAVQLMSLAVHLEAAGPANMVDFSLFLDHAMSGVQLQGMGLPGEQNIFVRPVKFPFLGGAEAMVFFRRRPVVKDGRVEATSLYIRPDQMLRLFGRQLWWSEYQPTQ